jgi:hypothetical protein
MQRRQAVALTFKETRRHLNYSSALPTAVYCLYGMVFEQHQLPMLLFIH